MAYGTYSVETIAIALTNQHISGGPGLVPPILIKTNAYRFRFPVTSSGALLSSSSILPHFARGRHGYGLPRIPCLYSFLLLYKILLYFSGTPSILVF